MRKIFWGVLFGLILVFCLQEFVYAGLGVDPVILEVIVTPGEPKKGVFRIFNDSEKPVGVLVRPERWAGSTLNFHEWLKLDPKQFTLDSRKSKKVSYEITVPEGATGELMCMVFFMAVEKGEGASPVGLKFGTPIYAIIKGTGNIIAKIESIEIDYDIEEDIIKGQFIIDNQSNVHIRPEIEVSILDEKGNLTARFKSPYKQPAQRGQRRPFSFQRGDLKLKPGKYKVIVKADCGKLYGIDKVFQGEGDFVIEEEEEKPDAAVEGDKTLQPAVLSPETK